MPYYATQLAFRRYCCNLDLATSHGLQNCRAAEQSVVLDHMFFFGNWVEEIISCDPVHRWWHTCDYRDIVWVGEGRHCTLGCCMEADFQKRFERWKNAVRNSLFKILRVESIDTDNNGWDSR